MYVDNSNSTVLRTWTNESIVRLQRFANKVEKPKLVEHKYGTFSEKREHALPYEIYLVRRLLLWSQALINEELRHETTAGIALKARATITPILSRTDGVLKEFCIYLRLMREYCRVREKR